MQEVIIISLYYRLKERIKSERKQEEEEEKDNDNDIVVEAIKNLKEVYNAKIEKVQNDADHIKNIKDTIESLLKEASFVSGDIVKAMKENHFKFLIKTIDERFRKRFSRLTHDIKLIQYPDTNTKKPEKIKISEDDEDDADDDADDDEDYGDDYNDDEDEDDGDNGSDYHDDSEDENGGKNGDDNADKVTVIYMAMCIYASRLTGDVEAKTFKVGFSVDDEEGRASRFGIVFPFGEYIKVICPDCPGAEKKTNRFKKKLG